MAGTGFYDTSQNAYFPKDTLTWTDLGNSPYQTWDNYTTWYQNLSGSTTVAFTSAIIDFGRSAKVIPTVTITTGKDGDTSEAITLDSSNEDIPTILVEGSADADMSSASSVTLTRPSSPTYTSLGAKRYYRVTATINSGTNAAPQGIVGINIELNTTTAEEILEGINTASYDDGSSATRTITTNNTYTDINFVGITPTSTVSDTVVTGTGAVTLYVASSYVTTGYFVGDTSSVTTSSITSVPLARCVSKSTDNFTIQLYLPNNATETDAVFDFLVRGLPQTKIDATTGSLGIV